MSRKFEVPKYPGIDDAERERAAHMTVEDEEPDFIAGAPNYDKFKGMTPEEILVMLNID